MAPSISTLMLQIRTIRARDSRVRAYNKSRSFARNSPSATAISDGAAHNIQIVATYVSNCSSASSADIPAAVIYCSIWIMRMRATKLATQFASAFFFSVLVLGLCCGNSHSCRATYTIRSQIVGITVPFRRAQTFVRILHQR